MIFFCLQEPATQQINSTAVLRDLKGQSYCQAWSYIRLPLAHVGYAVYVAKFSCCQAKQISAQGIHFSVSHSLFLSLSPFLSLSLSSSSSFLLVLLPSLPTSLSPSPLSLALLLAVRDRISLCSRRYPGSPSVEQAGLELRSL